MDKQPRGQDLWYRLKRSDICGFDSEFLMSGRVKAPEDVHSIQFSFGTIDRSSPDRYNEQLLCLLNRSRAQSSYHVTAIRQMPDRYISYGHRQHIQHLRHVGEVLRSDRWRDHCSAQDGR